MLAVLMCSGPNLFWVRFVRRFAQALMPTAGWSDTSNPRVITSSIYSTIQHATTLCKLHQTLKTRGRGFRSTAHVPRIRQLARTHTHKHRPTQPHIPLHQLLFSQSCSPFTHDHYTAVTLLTWHDDMCT